MGRFSMEIWNGNMEYSDIIQAGSLEFLLQDGRAHRRGADTSVASIGNTGDLGEIKCFDAFKDRGDAALLALELVHGLCRFLERSVVAAASALDQRDGQYEGDRAGRQNAQADLELVARRGHDHDGDDGTRG